MGRDLLFLLNKQAGYKKWFQSYKYIFKINMETNNSLTLLTTLSMRAGPLSWGKIKVQEI